MGAWGTGLYQDDIALDIRDTVKDDLRLGKPLNEIITRLKVNYDIGEYGNNDEEPVFWCVLADTLWKLGRLDDEIKNQALYWIEQGGDTERWKLEDPKLAVKREKVFSKIKEKLMSQQPHEKKISKQCFYECQWNIGDVFAMKLKGEMANKKSLLDTYLLFQVADKHLYSVVSDKTVGNLCPIVRARLTLSKQNPTLNDFINDEVIKTSRPCESVNWKNTYATLIYTTSTRVVPKDLIYLGNKELVIPNDDYGIFHDLMNICGNTNFVLWKQFENTMVNYYFGHNLKEFEMYHENE